MSKIDLQENVEILIIHFQTKYLLSLPYNYPVINNTFEGQIKNMLPWLKNVSNKVYLWIAMSQQTKMAKNIIAA